MYQEIIMIAGKDIGYGIRDRNQSGVRGVDPRRAGLDVEEPEKALVNRRKRKAKISKRMELRATIRPNIIVCEVFTNKATDNKTLK